MRTGMARPDPSSYAAGSSFSSRVWIFTVGPVKRAPVNCHASVLRALNPGASPAGPKLRVRMGGGVFWAAFKGVRVDLFKGASEESVKISIVF